MQRHQKIGNVVRVQETKATASQEQKRPSGPMPLDAQALKAVAGGKAATTLDSPHKGW